MTIVLCFLVANVFAQRSTVTGKVTSTTGEPLIQASVIEKGTTNGTLTDNNGNFSITVSGSNPVLVINYIGYAKQEIEVAGQTNLTVSLEEGNLLSQVEIVGSRNLNRSSTETPVPVDIIDIQAITSRTGQLDLNQLLQFVAPSFNSNRQTGSDGADHVDPASLRGLGPDQTLVLVNGKRRHQSSLVNLFGTRGRGNTGTDLNTIPAAAIERIEILRDGAAAQYGSDAIAGVINIVLKSTTKELAANANAGMYQASYRFDDKRFDGLNYNLNANYGFAIGKEGYVNLTGDYNFRDHTNRANTNPGDLARREFGDPKIQNASVYLNSRFPISTNAYVYVFGGINYRKGDAYAWTRFPTVTDDEGNEIDNPRSVRSIYPNGFDPIISSEINDRSATVGIRSIWRGLDIDLYNTFGQNRFHYFVNNTLNASLGESSPTSFDAGGFGLIQNTTGLRFSRLFKETLQGVNLAFGAEFRNESYDIFAGEERSWQNYNPTRPGGSQGFPGFRPGDEIKKGRSNIGVFVDAEADITQAFMLGAALRFENYSDFGSTLNWKVSSRYKISPAVAVRGSLSTGFRAPSLAQINFNSTFTNFVNGQPVDVLLARNNSPVTQALGIAPLKQETSTNASLGLSLTPLSNLSITVDGYYVKVKDRVVLTGQFSDEDEDIGDELQQLNVGLAQFFTNAISTSTHGLDVIVAHSSPAGEGRLNTTFAANFNRLTIDNRINTSEKLAGKEDIYFDLRERYFVTASAPRSKMNLTFDYGIHKFNFVLRFTRLGEIKLANWNYDAEDLDVYSPKITTDLSVRYNFTKNVNLTIGSSNLFNVYPDKSSPSLTESGGAWDPVQMGFNGAFYFAKLNLKF